MSNYSSLESRLLAKRYINPITDCWLFTGAHDSSGYGNIDVNGKMISSHRVSAHLYLGMPLNSSLHVLHRDEICDRRDCFNPNHLYLGDQADNYNDSVAKGTHNQARKIRCPKCGGNYSLKMVNRASGYERYCKSCTRRNHLRRKYGSK